jgi:mRNA interferase HigB
MHIVTRSVLTAFGKAHADADKELKDWIRVLRRKRYRTSREVKADFPKVDFIDSEKAVFDICRNDYRLVVAFVFPMGRVFIKHMLTHAEYARLMKRGLL